MSINRCVGRTGAAMVLLCSLVACAMHGPSGSLVPSNAGAAWNPASQNVLSPDVTPVGEFAYVPSWSSDRIYAYSVSLSKGVLKAVPGSPFSTGRTPTGVAIDRSGKYAYVSEGATTSGFAGTVEGFTINAITGKLTKLTGSPWEAGSEPGLLAVDPAADFLYAPSSGAIFAFRIDAATGALKDVEGSPFVNRGGPYAIAISPNGKFLYAGNLHSSDVSAFTIDSKTGRLHAVKGSPFAAGNTPIDANVTPNGKYLYVANRESKNVSAYAINATTGALSAVKGSPFKAGHAAGVGITPSGSFAYLPNASPANNVWGFTIGATGKLTPILGSPFPAGRIPIGFTVDATGKSATR
ncbi:MAG TPA: beta-propeller fold lactonase family protein [Candidatus Babeliales bacterium]|nr:beta-propeller fold lactonase family protein [Candidatus Babeliales bacterium]